MPDSYTDSFLSSAGWDSAHPEIRLQAIVRMGQTDFMDCARSLFSMSQYDTSAQVRAAATHALERMSEDAVAAALEFEARTPDPAHRVAAIKLLGRRRVSRSIKPLARYLDDKEGTVRETALRALEMIGGEVAAQALCEAPARRKEDLEERLEALGRMKEPCAVPFLVRVILQANWETTASAIQALGRIGDPSILRILQEAAGHDAAPVRYEAITALRRFESKRVAPALCAACYDEVPGVRKAARDALGSLKLKETTPFLCEALTLQSERLRLAAARRLTERGDPAAAPYLFAALEDDDDEIRTEARNALAKLEVRESVELLAGVLSVGSRLRLGAVRRLGKLGDVAAVPTLLSLLDDADTAVCAEAITTLGRLRASETAERVASLLDHRETKLRWVAAMALGELRRRSVLPAIRDRLRTFGGEPDAQVRLALKHALRQIETETERRADLPLIAGAPDADPATLPRPSGDRGGE